MTSYEEQDSDTPLGQACAWIVRHQAVPPSETDALAFDAWLDDASQNRAAYVRALATWREFGAAAPDLLAELNRSASRRTPARTGRSWIFAAGGMAAAAALAVAVLPNILLAPAAAYATATGKRQTVNLADGSTIDMNAQTRLTVTLSHDRRRVVMDQGEAIFDVAADAARPFEIEASGKVVHVVGTQFDVRNRPDGLSVVVARGTVQVRPGAGDDSARTYVLHAGQRLDIDPASPPRLSAANPADAFGWRSGHLVYRDEPLANVVADLNREFPDQIAIQDTELARSRISGVLVLDNQGDVLHRLALMLPLKSVRSEKGVLLQPR